VAARKKAGPGQYTVLRDFGEYLAGDVVELTDDDAALLVRDGMVAPGTEPAQEE
jgi:hypothetical protein